jgi:hypothetical protein
VFDLEEFSKAHEHTIVTLEAVSTFAAVVISLCFAIVAQRTNRTRVHATVSVNVIDHSTLSGKTKPRYIFVNVRNAGIMPVHIPLSFFHWTLPLQQETLMVLPHDYSQADPWVPQKQYPVEIKPRSSEGFFLTEIEMFRDQMRKNLSEANFLDRCRWRFLRARLITDDDKMFRVTLASSMRNELRRLRSEAHSPSA